MSKFVLASDEIEQIQVLLRDIASRYQSPENPLFLREADLYAHELPRRVRGALREFRLTEPAEALCVISGYPVDQAKIGPTPKHWREKDPANNTIEEEILLVLFGSLLGDVIGWSTQQDGRMVHDIFPIQGHEKEQLGSGSEELLTWHTEDAFHPYRGDYLGLMCLRNPDNVPTTFGSLKRVRLTTEQLRILSEPHFTIRPDESHLAKNRGQKNGRSAEEEALLQRAYAKIEKMWDSPEKIAVLSGGMDSPYLRLDPYFMDPVRDSTEAQAALDELIRQVDSVIEDQVLLPGDFLFVDNFKAVHGRKPFQARYDGTDRWLKRVNIARDLRKSRDVRLTADSRVIH
ncbi:MAG TPA: guanitoxin biosynthesis L-enduracididine beta-hydroxylase GntD [Longimicrobiaceae bacterium]|nr:guanitoxin biosynthesis L-enduracididine beta-hydroxylase GntD [Longimicrobiaceae bacterium]